MKIIKSLLPLLLISTVVGCASIAGENTRKVQVSSYPAGASIYVDNKQYGTTPAVINLPTYIYGGKAVTLKKPGFREQTLQVNTKFQPVALLDLLVWPTFVVDGIAGNLVKIAPEDLNLHTKLQVA